MSEKLKTISNDIIRRFSPCYDPSLCGIPDGEELPVKEWVEKYRKVLKSESDIIGLLCRIEYMSEKDMRLFAVWCAREALKLVENPDQRSIEACNVAERYANGEATKDNLSKAYTGAVLWFNSSATNNLIMYGNIAKSAMNAAALASISHYELFAKDAATSAAYAACYSAIQPLMHLYNLAVSAQVDNLLTYFEK